MTVENEENSYRVRTVESGLALVYYNDTLIGEVERYTLGGEGFEGHWGSYWSDNQACYFGREWDRLGRADFFGPTRKSVTYPMIAAHKKMMSEKDQ